MSDSVNLEYITNFPEITLESYFHFIEFVAATINGKSRPYEIGITSFQIKEATERKQFHWIVNPGPEFEEELVTHHIDPKSPLVDQDYSLFSEKLETYLNQFPEDQHYLVIRTRRPLFAIATLVNNTLPTNVSYVRAQRFAVNVIEKLKGVEVSKINTKAMKEAEIDYTGEYCSFHEKEEVHDCPLYRSGRNVFVNQLYMQQNDIIVNGEFSNESKVVTVKGTQRKTVEEKMKIKEQKKLNEMKIVHQNNEAKQRKHQREEERQKILCGNILNEERIKRLTNNLNDAVIHFIDFEFQTQKDHHSIPLEIGISSYCVLENEEVGYYHALIKPPPTIEMSGDPIHGINPFLKTIPLIPQNEVVNELKRLISVQEDCWICIKDEVIGLDFDCLKSLLGEIPSNVCVMTHHQLLDIVLNAFNIQSNPSFYTFMNTCYKRLHCAERCCYHSSIDDMFHCALADAQHTALMLLIILEKSGVDIKQYDPLPQINGKMLTFNGTNEFVFVCNDQTPQKELLELVFAEVHTNDVVFNQIVNTQVFKFKDADTVDIDAQHENELIQKDIKNAISKHPPNVIYMDSVRKEILQELQEDHFIVDKQVFLKTYFTKLIGQDRDSTYLLQIAKDSYNRAVIINQHTTKHLNTKQPSCLDKINSFISTIQHIGENTIDGVLERHGQESQPLVNEQ